MPPPTHVPEGWRPAGWAAELRRLASRCAPFHPDRAAYLRAWAEAVEQTPGTDMLTPSTDMLTPSTAKACHPANGHSADG